MMILLLMTKFYFLMEDYNDHSQKYAMQTFVNIKIGIKL